MTNKKWTDDRLLDAVKSSTTLCETIKKLGIVPRGANYKTVSKRINELQIDVSHFSEKLKKSTYGNKRMSVSELLVQDSSFRNLYRIKYLLTEHKLIEYFCSICKINQWNGEWLSLHLDHINGIKNDHRIENLRLLCPNCHSLTDTYCGKNKAIKAKQRKLAESK